MSDLATSEAKIRVSDGDGIVKARQSEVIYAAFKVRRGQVH